MEEKREKCHVVVGMGSFLYFETSWWGINIEFIRAHRFTFIQFMFEGLQPWRDMVAYSIEKMGIQLGNTTVETNWWNVIKSERDVKHTWFLQVNHLLAYWQSM